MLEVYGRDNCSYCVKAVNLLESRGIPYKYYKLGQDYTVEDYQKLFPGRRTVPGILNHGFPIGGYDELVGYLEETSGNSDDL